MILDGLTQCLTLVGANSEPGRVLLDCVKKVSGLVPQGSVTPQDKMAVLQKLGMEAQKQGQQMQMMRQQQAGGQPGQPGAPGQQPGGQPHQMPAAA